MVYPPTSAAIGSGGMGSTSSRLCEPVLLVLQAKRFQERVGVKLQAIPWSKLMGEPGA